MNERVRAVESKQDQSLYRSLDPEVITKMENYLQELSLKS